MWCGRGVYGNQQTDERKSGGKAIWLSPLDGLERRRVLREAAHAAKCQPPSEWR